MFSCANTGYREKLGSLERTPLLARSCDGSVSLHPPVARLEFLSFLILQCAGSFRLRLVAMPTNTWLNSRWPKSSTALDAQSARASAILRNYRISSVRLASISPVRAFPPDLRTAFHVQQGNNQHAISADLVKHSVWEAPYDASPGSSREYWPCLRKR
jgi:hypothetical protein